MTFGVSICLTGTDMLRVKYQTLLFTLMLTNTIKKLQNVSVPELGIENGSLMLQRRLNGRQDLSLE